MSRPRPSDRGAAGSRGETPPSLPASDARLLTPAEVVLTLGLFAYSPPRFATAEGIEIARRTYAEFMEAAREGGFDQASRLAGLLRQRRLSSRALDLAESAVQAAGDKGHRIFGALERLSDEGTSTSLH